MSRSYQHSKWAKNESEKWHSFFKELRPTKNPHKYAEMPMNLPSKYLTQRVCGIKFTWIGNVNACGRGHNAAKGSRRILSGMVRQKVKEEVRELIQEQLND